MTQQQKSSVGLREEEGTYSHIFAYRIPKKNHEPLINLQRKLAKIYKRHGMFGSRTYQLGKTNVYEGFSGFEKELGATSQEEVWIEVDSYKDASEFARVVTEIGADAEAGPLWGELAQLTSDHPIIMGEFTLLSEM